jgi:hypothetical protein
VLHNRGRGDLLHWRDVFLIAVATEMLWLHFVVVLTRDEFGHQLRKAQDPSGKTFYWL